MTIHRHGIKDHDVEAHGLRSVGLELMETVPRGRSHRSQPVGLDDRELTTDNRDLPPEEPLDA